MIDSNPFDAKPSAAKDNTAEEGDDTLEKPETIENPGGIAKSQMPRPSEAMLAELVQKAVGFDPGRGDQLQISFVPFHIPDTEGGQEVQYISHPLAMWLWALILLLIGAGLIAWSLFITERKRKKEAIADYMNQLQQKDAELKKQEEEEEGGVPDSTKLRQEVRDVTSKNVAATVEVMKGWLRPTLGRS